MLAASASSLARARARHRPGTGGGGGDRHRHRPLQRGRAAHRPAPGDTAREVEATGGKGHPYCCDHTSERDVYTLVAWSLRRFGRLDCVVDAVWGGNEGYDGERYPDNSGFGTPLWRRPAARLGESFEAGVYAQLLLARAVAPAMMQMRSRLIVTVTFDTTGGYLGDVFYDLAKAAMNRLSFAMAEELKPFGVTALGCHRRSYLLTSPLWEYLRARRTIYVVTNERAYSS